MATRAFDLLPIDWTAISALATFLAVAVALWLPWKLRRPRINGSISVTPGPTGEDINGNPTLELDVPEDWLQNTEIPKCFSVYLCNYSENPAWIIAIMYSCKPLGRKEFLDFLWDDPEPGLELGPNGRSENFDLSLVKMDASVIRKVWALDSMNRYWRLDTKGINRYLRRKRPD